MRGSTVYISLGTRLTYIYTLHFQTFFAFPSNSSTIINQKLYIIIKAEKKQNALEL